MAEEVLPSTRCTRCGKQAVRARARAGRFTDFLYLTVEIPADVLLPECLRCHHIYLSSSSSLLQGIRRSYEAALKNMAKAAIRSLEVHIPQKQLELLLGLSQGYLCRIKLGYGNPSAPLVGFLGILALDPRLLETLKDYWATPQTLSPVVESQKRHRRFSKSSASGPAVS